MGRKPVTVSLPAELVKETALYCKKRSVTLSEITRDAIRTYLYQQEMRQARSAFTAHLHKRGLHSEQTLLRVLGE